MTFLPRHPLFIAIAIATLLSTAARCVAEPGPSEKSRKLHAATPLESAETPSVAKEWAQVPEILSRIHPPLIPDREFSIAQFGATADGKQDCSEAIAKAIAAATKAGGGRVTVPAGEYLTGPIHLKSRIELHLDGGATLKFTTDPKAYLPAVRSWFEGMECYNYSPLIRVRG